MILGGLLTSAFLTVMVIPIVYSLVDDLTSFVRHIAASVVRGSYPDVPVPVPVPLPDGEPDSIDQLRKHP